MRNVLPATVSMALATDRLLPDLAPAAAARLRAALQRRAVTLHEGVRVSGYRDGAACLDAGEPLAADWFVVVTGVDK